MNHGNGTGARRIRLFLNADATPGGQPLAGSPWCRLHDPRNRPRSLAVKSTAKWPVCLLADYELLLRQHPGIPNAGNHFFVCMSEHGLRKDIMGERGIFVKSNIRKTTITRVGRSAGYRVVYCPQSDRPVSLAQLHANEASRVAMGSPARPPPRLLWTASPGIIRLGGRTFFWAGSIICRKDFAWVASRFMPARDYLHRAASLGQQRPLARQPVFMTAAVNREAAFRSVFARRAIPRNSTLARTHAPEDGEWFGAARPKSRDFFGNTKRGTGLPLPEEMAG